MKKATEILVYCESCGRLNSWKHSMIGLYDEFIKDSVDLKLRCMRCYQRMKELLYQEHLDNIVELKENK